MLILYLLVATHLTNNPVLSPELYRRVEGTGGLTFYNFQDKSNMSYKNSACVLWSHEPDQEVSLGAVP